MGGVVVARVIVLNSRVGGLDLTKEILAGHSLEVLNVANATEALPRLRRAHGVLIGSTPQLPGEVIAQMGDCRIITRYGIGVDNIDLAAARQANITICNVPDYCLDEVSTHAVMLILACNRQLFRASEIARSGRWSLAELTAIRSLQNQVLGLVGFGAIANRVASKAQAFGMTVRSYDPYVSSETMRQHATTKVGLEELLSTSDIISVHAPLNADTSGLIGPSEFKLMKPTAHLVNTARAEIIVESALVAALDNNIIAAAALDVFSGEPVPADHPLLNRPNVIATPHIAALSVESLQRLEASAARQVATALSGGAPEHVVVGV